MTETKLNDKTFRELRDFIYEKSGIYVSDTKKYLIENRLHRRLLEKKVNSYEDYLYLIKYSGNGGELTSLLDAVTTNETYFYREPLHFEVIVNSIIPYLIKNGLKRIKIWSSACSTGEEPYTLAMLLQEKYPLKNLEFEIYGSDISNNVLATARKGVYSSYSVRNLPGYLLKKHFTTTNGSYLLSPEIKGMVRLLNINLVNPGEMVRVRGMDLVLCRNVLIYFDEKAKKRSVSHIYDALKPGGYLLVGAAESLHNVTRVFKPSVVNKTIVYKKV